MPSSSSDSVSRASVYRPPIIPLENSKKAPKEGRSWKDIGKSVAKKFLIASVILIGILAVAAFICGIVALTYPGAFGILGTAITTALSWLLANGVYLLVASTLLLGLSAAAVIVMLAKRRFGSKSQEASVSEA